MRKTMEKMKEKKGITLIALVVTIAVILILAGITVGMVTSDNGVLKETKNAKTLAEIDNEKSIVERAKMLTMMRSKNGSITYDVFEPALKEEAGKMPTEVSDAVETIEVLFTDSNRYYEIDEDGNVSEPQEVVKDKNAGDITKGGRCDGSEEKPYEISCIEDLVVLSNMTNGTGIKLENGKAVTITSKNVFTNKYIILTKNLNFKSKYSYNDSTRTDFGNLNNDDTDGNSLITEMTTGTGFIPIGQFKGTFEGNKKTISNIYENKSSDVSVFSFTGNNAKIKNLCVEGNVTAKNCSRATGLIGGAAYDITIENCINKININSENCNYVAGIIGNCWYGTVTIINTINAGNITSVGQGENGGAFAGGFIGANENNVNICNSGNIGNLDASVGAIGGIIGQVISNKANINNVYNIGKITHKTTGQTGGVIGKIGSANLENVWNLGIVKGKTGNWTSGIASLVRMEKIG